MFTLYYLSVIVSIVVTLFSYYVEKECFKLSAFTGLLVGCTVFVFMMLGAACYKHQFGG